jgi:ABC-type Fe3+-hydroxamate transport system substrate-binding protein
MRFYRLRFGLMLVLASALHAAAAPTPQRIIALAPHLTELVYALGAQNRLIGVMDHSDYPPAAAALPIVGNYANLNIEKILALKPDLVLTWPGGNPAHQLAQLEQLGIPVFGTHPKRLSELPSLVQSLGQKLGVPERGNQLASQLEGRYQALLSHQSPLKVRVFYQIWHQPMMTVSSNSWLDDTINLCGGVNIFADNAIPYPQVALEQVIARKPQAVIIASHQGGEGPWQQWSQLDVVKQGHLFMLSPDLMNRFTPRLLDGTEQLCQALATVRASLK